MIFNKKNKYSMMSYLNITEARETLVSYKTKKNN